MSLPILVLAKPPQPQKANIGLDKSFFERKTPKFPKNNTSQIILKQLDELIKKRKPILKFRPFGRFGRPTTSAEAQTAFMADTNVMALEPFLDTAGAMVQEPNIPEAEVLQTNILQAQAPPTLEEIRDFQIQNQTEILADLEIELRDEFDEDMIGDLETRIEFAQDSITALLDPETAIERIIPSNVPVSLPLGTILQFPGSGFEDVPLLNRPLFNMAEIERQRELHNDEEIDINELAESYRTADIPTLNIASTSSESRSPFGSALVFGRDTISSNLIPFFSDVLSTKSLSTPSSSTMSLGSESQSSIDEHERKQHQTMSLSEIFQSVKKVVLSPEPDTPVLRTRKKKRGT